MDDYLESLVIELSGGGRRGCWEPDALTASERRAARAVGVTPHQLKTAAADRVAYLPRPRGLRFLADEYQCDYDEYCEEMSIGGAPYRA